FVPERRGMQHAIVLANGEIQDADELRERLAGVSSGALVLAANGGSRHVQALGLTPDLVIGDLDSISPALREQFEAQGVAMRQAPVRKDETDLELALLHAAAQGRSEEHTSELQSRENLVCRLLLEKKNEI